MSTEERSNDEAIRSLSARLAAVERERDNLRAAIVEHDKVRAELMREQEARRLNEWQAADKQIKALIAAAKSRNVCHETGDELDEALRCQYAPGLHRHGFVTDGHWVPA